LLSYNFQEEIKEYVESVCNILPRTVASPCREFIELYGDVVIALLAQSLDPKTICAEIKACSGSKVKHSVLIGKYFG
jgi:saposin